MDKHISLLQSIEGAAIFIRGLPDLLLEQPGEMLWVFKPSFIRDFTNRLQVEYFPTLHYHQTFRGKAQFWDYRLATTSLLARFNPMVVQIRYKITNGYPCPFSFCKGGEKNKDEEKQKKSDHDKHFW